MKDPTGTIPAVVVARTTKTERHRRFRIRKGAYIWIIEDRFEGGVWPFNFFDQAWQYLWKSIDRGEWLQIWRVAIHRRGKSSGSSSSGP